MLFWALLAAGQITMRKIDGWPTLAEKPTDPPIDLAALADTFTPPENAPQSIPTSFATAPFEPLLVGAHALTKQGNDFRGSRVCAA